MASDFLAKALSRPEEGAITKAITTLQVLNALDDNEQLTSLGYAVYAGFLCHAAFLYYPTLCCLPMPCDALTSVLPVVNNA